MSKKFYGGIHIQDRQEFRLYDADSSNFIDIKAPIAVGTNYQLTLPTNDGSLNDSLTTDGAGILSWVSHIASALTSGSVLIGDGQAQATDTVAQGDVLADSATGLTIKDDVIDNDNINSAAAIEFSKMEALTANRATATDASGFIVESAVTDTELGYVAGVTSAIQTQIDNLSSTISNFEWQDSALDYVVDNTAVPASEVSGDRYILSHDGGAPHANYDGASAGDIVEFNGTVWVATTPTTGMFAAADDEADKLYLWGGASWDAKNFEATTASLGLTKVGFDIRLDASAAGDALALTAGVLDVQVDDTTVEVVADALQLKDGGITNAKVNATAAIDLSKLAALTANRAISTDASGFIVASDVTDAELNYLDGVTSAIQTQLDDKASLALDNLAAVQINTDLIPDADGVHDLGSATDTWDTLHAEQVVMYDNGFNLTLRPSPTQTESVDYRMPPAAPAVAGYVLSSSTGGVMSWVSNSSTVSHTEDWETADTGTFAITHNLNTLDVVVQVYDKATGATIEIDDMARTSVNVVTVSASSAPPAGGWRVVILSA